MALTIAVLGHHDAPRYNRALRSAHAAAACAPGALAQPVVDVTGALPPPDGAWLIEGGTAGRAKAALVDRWASTTALGDWLFLLDGDDVLYPCAAQAMQRDIATARADLIGYYGFDTPATGALWGRTAVPPWPREPGPGEQWDRYPYITSWAPTLWSLPAARAIAWDRDMQAYEDGLICYQALALHQRGQLRVCVSGAVDILAVDRSTPASVQKTCDMDFWADELRRRRTAWVSPDRSNWGEMQIIAPSPLMDRDMRMVAWRMLAEGRPA